MRSFAGRDILSLKDFERNEFQHVFEIADRLEPIARERRNSDILSQKTLVTAFYQPSIIDRQGYEPWLASGGQDAAQRANTIWKSLLREYRPPPIDPGIEEVVAEFVARREKELDGVNLYR